MDLSPQLQSQCWWKQKRRQLDRNVSKKDEQWWS